MPRRRIIPAELRKAGAEVEFNRVTTGGGHYEFQEAIRKFRSRIHHDGSCGYEAVTPPLAGDAMKRTLERLAAEMRKAGARQNNLCGTHVHVDVSDYDWKAARRLCLLYAKTEPLLYLIAGQHRANNSYCRPNGKFLQRAITTYPDDPEAGVLAGIYYHGILDIDFNVDEMGGDFYWYHPTEGETMDRNLANLAVAAKHIPMTRPDKHHDCRYVGMNLCPMISARAHGRRDCTVEFRMHRETMDSYRLVGWAKLLVQMVSWARKTTDDQFAAALTEINSAKLLSNTVAPDSSSFIKRRIREYMAAVIPRNRRIHFSRTNGFTMNESRWAIGRARGTICPRFPRERQAA